MALQGTLKDFGVADIFQLIGMQRKTGLLTLENNEDSVTVTFRDGQVAGADTRLRNLEDLLGSVLVRTGRITEAQLQQALKTQKRTLQRLGYILVHSSFISEEELAEALRIQVTQIVYRLFRWRDGRYHFDSRDIPASEEQFTPISAETILMEGARMIDEWPIIERKIKSERMVLRKTEAGAAVEAPVGSLVDENVDIDFGFQGRGAGEGQEEGIRLTAEEREVLRMVDGRAPVQDLVDRSSLGEFDTYRTLYELMTRNLIEEVKASPVAAASETAGVAGRIVGATVPIVFLVFALLAVGTLGSNPLTPWRLSDHRESTDRLRTYASRVRLERIERSLRVFYLDTGTMPDRLELLSDGAYLGDEDLLDPWGRPYAYRLVEGSFQLTGFDSDGRPEDDLTITRRLTTSQRMMIDGAVPGT